nr:MAG TPA: hypothetical protein [Caudoviricetes sp.]
MAITPFRALDALSALRVADAEAPAEARHAAQRHGQVTLVVQRHQHDAGQREGELCDGNQGIHHFVSHSSPLSN